MKNTELILCSHWTWDFGSCPRERTTNCENCQFANELTD